MEDILTKVLNWIMSSAELVASEGFRIAMQQAYTIAILNTIAAVICLILFILCIYGFFSVKAEKDTDGIGMMIFFTIVTAIPFGIFFCEALARFLNPEYYAIRIIMNLVR